MQLLQSEIKLAVTRNIFFAIFIIFGAGLFSATVNAQNAPQDKPVSAESKEEVDKFQAAIKPYIEKAKKTYPEAKQKFLVGLPPEHAFYITTQLHDEKGKFEQVFIFVKKIEKGMVTGIIANDIEVVSGYKNGDSYTFPEAELLDRTITKPDGSEEGNFVGKFLETYQKQK